MVRNGSYPKGVAKRLEILDTALEVVARVGYSATTVKELADAVGLTQNGLLYYFGSKENLFVEILKRRDEIDAATFGEERGEDIGHSYAHFVRHNADVPGLVQLHIGLASEATTASHPAHAYFAEKLASYRQQGADAIRLFQARGEMPAGLDPEKLATLLVAVSDGLQLQWLYHDRIDMAEHFLYLWGLVGELTATRTE